MEQEVTSLEELLDRMEEADPDGDEVAFSSLLDEIGNRSFGPFLLLAGLITVMPLVGDIPGVPTVMGIFVILTSGQLLLHRDHFWLPEWMLERSVKRDKLCKALDWLRKPAGWIDRWLRPRLKKFVSTPGVHVIAVVSMCIGLAMPAMEFVPFSANGAGAGLIALGLALIFRDGLVAIIAIVIALGTFGFVGYSLLM